jgi:DNA-binding transcriptional ArsR family regulator
MKITQMEQTADRVAGLLKLLSTRQRLMTLCHLVEGEKSVGALCDAVGMKPPAMSQQLAILRREGAIAARRDGQTIYYSIVDDDVRQIMAFLYSTFCQGETGA